MLLYLRQVALTLSTYGRVYVNKLVPIKDFSDFWASDYKQYRTNNDTENRIAFPYRKKLVTVFQLCWI